MSVVLSCEFQVDLPAEFLEKNNIAVVHMYVSSNEKTYRDDEMPLAGFFELARKEGKIGQTAAANLLDYEQHFAALLEKYDEVVHIAISSKLSSCFSNASVAANGNPRIHVYDSKRASGGTAIQLLYAMDLLKQGKSAQEIVDELLRRRDCMECSFQIDTLEFLQRGGRCSRAMVLGANLLKIKPVIVCTNDGQLKLGKLHRGKMSRVVEAYFDEILAQKGIDKTRVVIEYSTLDEEGMVLYKECLEKLKKAGFKEIVEGVCSPIAAYHAGPNIIGAQFYLDHQK